VYALAPFLPELDKASIFSKLGGPPEKTLRDLLKNEIQVEEALKRLHDYGFKNIDQEKPFDGAEGVLSELKARRFKIGLWTGRDRGTTEMILRDKQWMSFFDGVVCGDDLPTHKPCPDGLLGLFSTLSVSADQCVFIGDADADVLGGHDAGVATILIEHSRKIESAIRKKAWAVVEKPEDAYGLIQEMLMRT
jgi:phosphoglycolate phosphatase